MPTVQEWRRRNRRKAKKIGRRRKAKSQALKLYKFKFAQQPAYISTTLNMTGGGTNTITGYNVGSVNNTQVGVCFPAKSGFARYFDFGESFQFRLSDLKNSDPYRALYDQWRLDGVSVTIQCLQNTTTLPGLGLSPTVYISTDYDDATVPNSADEVVGRPGFRMFKFGNKMKSSYTFRMKPKVAMVVYNEQFPATAITGYGSHNGWLDCTNASIPHYGMKLFYTDVFAGSVTDPVSLSLNTAFKIDVKYHITFRTPLNAC